MFIVVIRKTNEGGALSKHIKTLVRPGKVAYFSGCEARPGRASHPPGSKSLDRWG